MYIFTHTGVQHASHIDTSATSEAGTAYPSGAHEFTPSFIGVRIAQYFVFYVVFCVPISLVFYSLSDSIVCGCGIFKHFLPYIPNIYIKAHKQNMYYFLFSLEIDCFQEFVLT